jgi:hypothetical protein
MSEYKKYALDTNIFVEAKRRYYAFDVCPGFWNSLIWHHGQGLISSIDRIKAEIDKGADDLAKWINDYMPDICFASTDKAAISKYFGETMAWVQAQSQYIPAAKAKYADSADGWLIAYAKANNLVLVTHEVPNPFVKNNVPIPNVCAAFGVAYVNTFDMLRDLQTSFTWQPANGASGAVIK